MSRTCNVVVSDCRLSLVAKSLLFFTQGNHFIDIEQFLAPFRQIGRVNNNLRAQMTIALLIRAIWRAEYIIFLLQSTDRVMLNGAGGQDAKLPARVTIMLMWGMRAGIVLDLYGSVPMASIEGVRRLERMGIWVL